MPLRAVAILLTTLTRLRTRLGSALSLRLTLSFLLLRARRFRARLLAALLHSRLLATLLDARLLAALFHARLFTLPLFDVRLALTLDARLLARTLDAALARPLAFHLPRRGFTHRILGAQRPAAVLLLIAPALALLPLLIVGLALLMLAHLSVAVFAHAVGDAARVGHG